LRYSQDKTGYVHQRAMFQDQENALSAPSATSDKKKKKEDNALSHGFYYYCIVWTTGAWC
jgi:hypothetical protein